MCPTTTRNVSGYCDLCEPVVLLSQKVAARERDRARGTAAERGYGSRWRRERQAFMRETALMQRLREYPCCVSCLAKSEIKQATVVDHITPHRGDDDLMWDRKNWQCLCKECHDEKTAREDGAFGNTRK